MTDDIVARLRRVKSISCRHSAGEFFVNFQLMLPSGADRTISALANAVAGCITIHADAANEIERLRQLLGDTERLGGCARDQTTTQFCAEAVRLERELAEARSEIYRLQIAACCRASPSATTRDGEEPFVPEAL
jgi:hypothetical protein